MRTIYLDYAAATPMDKQVLRAMQPYFERQFYNPSATYLAGRAARAALDEARATVSRTLGARPGEIIFTAGATEANNLAISGVMKQFPKGELLVSSIEHDSVLVPAKEHDAKLVPVNHQGIIEVAKLAKQISAKTVLVSIMLVNNELGTIQPIAEAASLIKQERKRRLQNGNSLPIYLHTDAAQAGNWLDLHVARLGVDLMSLNGGKIYGPKQSGALFIKAGATLKPLIVGGGQEQGLRSGTENVAACIGLAKAVELAQNRREQASSTTLKLREIFIANILKELPQAQINGSSKTAPHIISLTILGIDNERLMMQLDEVGIQVAVGSACSASSDEPSHVLKAIGLNDSDARATLRISLGRQTSEKDIKTVITNLKNLV